MPKLASAQFLIQTKLNRPRVSAVLVERPRLYAMLDSSRPLVLVSAPAGYGKTTLISDWVQASRLRCAWVSLDAGDNQPAVFMRYLAAAIERVLPGAALALAEAPSTGVAVAGAVMARNLADALEQIDERFVLVLDDYHVITEPSIHLFLSQLLRYPPPCLKLVVASRYDPPLPIAVMRAHDQVVEIRAHNLRFTQEETGEYVAQELERGLSAEMITSLMQSTEGWITGLHLATLVLRNKDAGSAAAFVRHHNRFAIDYLAAEVLAQQPSEVQMFVLKTAILQRLCPGLCDAVVATSGQPQQSRRILQYLEDQDLFLVSLDGAHQWFRYHHLFQQLLMRTLNESAAPGELAALYAAASHWCDEQGLLDEAVNYALAGGNQADAIQLIERNRIAAMNREDWPQLERWVHGLPPTMIETSPQLLLLHAWHLHKERRMDDVLARLELAEGLLDGSDLPLENTVRLRGEIDTLRSEQFFNKLQLEQSCRAALRALEQLPLTCSNIRGLAWFYLGGSTYLMSGLQAALVVVEPALAEDRAQQSVVSSRILLIKCFIFWVAADLYNLKETAEDLLRLSRRQRWHESALWARYFLGCVFYQHNELDAAAAAFREVVDQRQLAHGFAFVHAALGLASTLQAQGEARAAVETSALVLEYAQKTGDPDVQQAAVEFHASLAARQGRLEDAYAWIVSANRNLQVAVMQGFSVPGIAMVDMLIRLEMPASLLEAQRMLGDLQTAMVRIHNDRFLIDVLILKALLCSAQRQRADALPLLERAVALAQPGGVLRAFLDAAPALDPLLDALHLQGLEGAFVQRIGSERAQRSAAGAQSRAEQPLPPKPSLVQPSHPDLIELLTQREVEVLQLLALRLTNKEIGQALAISTGTVKQHTRNVFRKLHADNRRDAIVQARNMGFQLDAPSRAK